MTMTSQARLTLPILRRVYRSISPRILHFPDPNLLSKASFYPKARICAAPQRKRNPTACLVCSTAAINYDRSSSTYEASLGCECLDGWKMPACPLPIFSSGPSSFLWSAFPMVQKNGMTRLLSGYGLSSSFSIRYCAG